MVSLLCNPAGFVARTDEPATRPPGEQPGESPVAPAAPGSDDPLTRLLEPGADGRLCVRVRHVNQTVAHPLAALTGAHASCDDKEASSAG